MRILKRVLVGLLIILIVIQFIPVDRSVPQDIDPKLDLINITHPSDTIVKMLKTACYDCHSYETKYPWYAYTAPTKWVMQDHIVEGREHLNFSTWGQYPADKRTHKAEEGWEEVQEGHMPISSYLWMHADAKLNDEQRKLLIDFFKELEKQ